MKLSKKALSLAVLMSVASVGFVMSASAAEMGETTHMDEVVVEGQADAFAGGLLNTSGTVGILGEKKVMDTPFTVQNVSTKDLDLFMGNGQPLDRALAGVPSVNPSGSELHGDFNIRGFRTNGNAFYVNGVNGMMTQFIVPTFAIDSIDIVSGPNSMLGTSMVVYEGDTAGGLINLRTKKAAEKDFVKYKQTFSGQGSFGEYIDVSGRFGKNKEWGVRLNAENVNGETSMDEANIKEKGVALNIDHKGSKSNTNLFATYTDKDVLNGVRWFKLVTGGVTKLPAKPDGSKNYSAEGTWKAGYGWFATLNHEQKINDNWKLMANAGYSRQKLNQNCSPNMSSYWIKNDAGDYDLFQTNSATPQRIYYTQIASENKFKTGEVKHTVVTSIDKEWRNRMSSANSGNKTVGTGNIYTHIFNQFESANTITYTTRPNSHIAVWGASILDNLEFGKWNAMVGIHRHEGTTHSYNATSKTWNAAVKSGDNCPTYSLGYKPNDKVLLYGNHSENFNLGVTAPKGTKNEDQVMDPAHTKQNEVGVKYMNHGNLFTAAYFDIDQSSYMTVDSWYKADGKVNHKGFELSYAGKLARKWNGNLALAWMDATYENNSAAWKNGLAATGIPKWRGSASVEYEADKNFNVLARATYTGSTPFFTVTDRTSNATASSLRLHAKPFMVYDLGVSYKTQINTVPVKLTAMCYNVFDKDYWMVSRGDQVYVSAPRTFFVSAEFTI